MPKSKDTTEDGIQIENLTKENSELNKKFAELLGEKEALSKNCDELRRNCDKLRDMVQKNPGKVGCGLPW